MLPKHFLALFGFLGACSSTSAAVPTAGGLPDDVQNLEGDIASDVTLEAGRRHVLRGTVFVRPGATLRIEKGTTITGDPALRGILVVQAGARIIAEGTADEPIVFTSYAAEGFRKPGDWGGVILLGRAPVGGSSTRQPEVEGLSEGGAYGGDDEDDDSGVLRYVRIEYGGYVLGADDEVNGLTLAGVGRKTVVDHVQVRHTIDDCFEFFGGTVNARYLACQHPGDDGIDWDLGYRGKLQFVVVQAKPGNAEAANGFEGDDGSKGREGAPVSEPTIYNATLCGSGDDLAREQYALLLRTGTRGHLFNVAATGFEAGLDVQGAETAAAAIAGALDLRSSVFFGHVKREVAYTEGDRGNPLSVEFDDDGPVDAAGTFLGPGFDEEAWFRDPARSNRVADLGLSACSRADAPVFGAAVPAAGASPPDDGFFDPTASHVGAFRSAADKWATEGNWARWTAK